MKSMMKTKHHESGFTLIEVLVVIVIMAILAAIAIPAFSGWLPDYRLRRAARDLYSNLQRAKMGAIKANQTWGVVFDAGSSSYSIWSLGPNKIWDNGTGDDTPQNITINLSDYEGVNYGNGNALKDMYGNPFGPVITYNPDPGSGSSDPVAVFSSRGTVDITGCVYLCNSRGTAYLVGTPSPAGVVIIRKHDGGDDWV